MSRHQTVLGPTEMDLMGADWTFAQLSPILALPTDPPRYHSVLSWIRRYVDIYNI